MTPDRRTSDALDRTRAAAAADGREVLLASDPDERALDRLRDAKVISALAERCAEHGLGVRLLPASYAPDPRDRARTCAWVEDSVLHIGVTAQSTAAQAARAGARFLLAADGYQSTDTPASEAAVEAYALAFVDDYDRDAVMNVARVLVRNLGQRRLEGAGSDQTVQRTAAVHSWSVLAALDGDDRATVREQVGRVLPSVMPRLAACEDAAGVAAPRTGPAVKQAADALERALKRR